MEIKIKIYLDAGANIKFIEDDLRDECLFISFPYDALLIKERKSKLLNLLMLSGKI